MRTDRHKFYQLLLRALSPYKFEKPNSQRLPYAMFVLGGREISLTNQTLDCGDKFELSLINAPACHDYYTMCTLLCVLHRILRPNICHIYLTIKGCHATVAAPFIMEFITLGTWHYSLRRKASLVVLVRL